MPSTKHRINLTVSDDIYERIVAYKNEVGLANDATAALQLVVLQLNVHDNSKMINNLVNNMSLSQLQEISNEGLSFIKNGLNSEK